MKVSVLIPTYNSNKYLSECLDSVVAQDFNSMEILISDDVSTDDTVGTAAYGGGKTRKILVLSATTTLVWNRRTVRM
jgi:glycosyltransferase involved in cell wall biosynthesis